MEATKSPKTKDVHARPSLVGRTIVAVRSMTKQELHFEGWDYAMNGCAVIVLDDGTKIYPSRDYEGNDAGAMFGVKKSREFKF